MADFSTVFPHLSKLHNQLYSTTLSGRDFTPDDILGLIPDYFKPWAEADALRICNRFIYLIKGDPISAVGIYNPQHAQDADEYAMCCRVAGNFFTSLHVPSNLERCPPRISHGDIAAL
ncbi:MAG: hypothetical protein SP1CHLAM54_10900 [Chlamydiia bacterium]|nr:hypothetical protein [Chlamydiia bacterium]MCH9615995.1 hypothetical protein [Chlamydiia bacterium]MCH9629018.1 hypothetical protein [Chlamydiia bacterium]